MGAIVDVTDVLLELGLCDVATEEERTIAGLSITRAEGSIRQFLGYDPVQRSRTEYYPLMKFNEASPQGVWEVSDTHAYWRRISQTLSDDLQVRHIPIRSITSLWINYDGRNGARSFDAEHLKTEGDDYWINADIDDSSGTRVCRDGIVRSHGLWTTTRGTVKITYVAGYTASELLGQDSILNASPIYSTVINEASRRMIQAMGTNRKVSGVGFVPGSVNSERLGDYSYSAGTSGGSTGGSTSDRLTGGINDLLPESKEALSGFRNYGLLAL